MPTKPVADYGSFAALDIRVGRIVAVEEARTKKPTYRLSVDFGPEIGVKVSCGAYRNYPRDFLLGRQVIGIVIGILNPTDQKFFVGIGFAVPITTAGGGAGVPQY